MSKATRLKKEAEVKAIKDLLSEAQAFVIIDYKGVTVAEETELRAAYRKESINYSVLKNTLLKIALNDLGYTQFDEHLVGSTSLAVSITDLIAPAKVSMQKISTLKKMKIKCGMADGKFLSQAECLELAKLPAKETLIAQLLNLLLSPISSFARAIAAIAEQKEAN